MKINENFGKVSKSGDLSRWYVNEFVKKIAKTLPEGARVLDAGAGECAYKDYFRHCRYYATDLAVGEGAWNYGNLDCVSFLDKLAFVDSSFDSILCTQVLEHLEWPRESVREFFRVLRPGGKLILTAPMMQFEHQTPYDFFRYTSYGLRSIMENADFRDISIEPFGGFFVKLAYQLPRIITFFPASGLRKGSFSLKGAAALPFKWTLLLLIRLMQSILIPLDRLDKTRNDTIGWAVIATKK